MTFGERVFIYCERGTDGALWAEPINAVTNVAFLIAALGGLLLLLRRPAEQRGADHYLLVALVFIIGLGSLAFHMFADRGTSLADIVPIGLFMLVYLGFALNRFLGVPPGWTVLLVIAFAAIVAVALQVRCWDGAMGFPGSDIEGVRPCLNGSLAYVLALLALIGVGLLLTGRNHPAAPWILWAAAVFTISITLRSLDMALCEETVIAGRKIGTHFAWHLLNALTLFLLLRASLCAEPMAKPGQKPSFPA
ncbi:MAG: ceramidase domain-containing protein [Methyloceanibacter sp.]